MKLNRYFTNNLSSPYEGINFVQRTSQLSKLDGTVLFENDKVSVPESWSQVATDILAQKYFRKRGLGKDGSEGETDARQVFDRLVGCWTHWGQKYNYFDSEEDAKIFSDDLKFMLANQIAAPNSPQWFNTGLHWAYGIDGPAQGHYYVDPDTKLLTASTSSYAHPQPHACFILGVKDDLVNDGGIMDLWTREARLFKYGSGTGTNFSKVRGREETLGGGGRSSGLMSFLVIGDKSAGAIKSGGTTRRAAKMVILDVDHPDIEEFIDWKVNEERKVVALSIGSQFMRRHWDRMCKAVEAHPKRDTSIANNDKLKKAIIGAKKDGLPQAFISQCLGRLQNGDLNRNLKAYDTGWEGEGYQTVNGMNSNNSVRLSNDFLDRVKANSDWKLTFRTNGKVSKTLKAKDLWARVNQAAWACADPGIQFDTTINEWHTCPADGRIEASNPCCITGDTLVAVADGRNAIPIKDLVGGNVNVYTWDHEKKCTTIAPMHNIGIKKSSATIYRVTLDDGSSFRATDDHLIMLRDGAYRKVKDLQAGDSLTPFHSKLATWPGRKAQRQYIWTGKGWKAQYRWIWEHENGKQTKGFHIHHKDMNSKNDNLDNLELLSAKDHVWKHREQMLGDNNPTRRCMTLAWRKKISIANLGDKNSMFGRKHLDSTRQKMREKAKIRWTSEAKLEMSARALHWMKKAKEDGRKIGRTRINPLSINYTYSCSVCRNEFQTKTEGNRFCSNRCMSIGTASLRSAKLKGRHITDEHKEKLKLSSYFNSGLVQKDGQYASLKARLLKAAKLLLENGYEVSSANWESLKLIAKNLGAKHYPKAEYINEYFKTDSDFLEAAINYNHKVISVEFAGVEDVYDGTVDGYHNFAILTSLDSEAKSSGIFIHNSEYMFLSGTACNLASINVCKLMKDGLFDVDGYKHAIRLWTMVLEISVLMAQYPSAEIAQKSYEYRTLGLGYANLGSFLMRLGIPYDSELGRQWAGALTAILTGEAYATSALMAKEIGPFEAYERNKEAMLKVIRNHRYAANNAKTTDYEDLSITPNSLKIRGLPKVIGTSVKESWDRALNLGMEHGYRNAQVTCIAPTGTIGLLMDCDTTGVEPDFALVKFKKLAGGGYFKLVNGAVPTALDKLGYKQTEIENIINYVVGTKKITEETEGINLLDLKAKKVPEEVFIKIERTIATAFDPSFLFTVQSLGENTFSELGLDPKNDQGLLEQLGFSDEKIELFYEDIHGHYTIEGAPGLKDEHLAVFDCASKCGKKGKRFIGPMGHVMMMAQTQPFLSGAISKTVNLPAETSMDEIAYIHEEAWKLGLKSIAIYRDGSKMSQALATNLDLLDGAEQLLDDTENIQEKIKALSEHMVRAYRKKLPTRRGGYTQSATVGTTKLYLRTGDYEDGALGEIFIDTHKEGTAFRSMLNSFAIAISIGLQYGVPLEEFCDAFLFTKFEPAGMVSGNDHIKMASSIIDYIFRELAITYLDKMDLSHKPEAEPSRPKNTHIERGAAKREIKETIEQDQELAPAITGAGVTKAVIQARQLGYTGDICSKCGDVRMVRNGTCLKCESCGETTGCS